MNKHFRATPPDARSAAPVEGCADQRLTLAGDQHLRQVQLPPTGDQTS